MFLLKVFKSVYFYLLLILIIAFIVRLYDINRAVADWHAWRQADTAAVSRIYYEQGLNLLYPKYFDMSDVSGTGKANLGRYRFVEFPIYNTAVYIAYLIHGGVNVMYARLVSVLFSLGGIIFLFLIVRRYWGNFSALLAAIIYSVLPFAVFYSRVILPETAMIFFALGGFYFADRWVFENKKKFFILGIVLCASALLAKPFAIFYFLPLLYVVLLKEKKVFPLNKKYFIFAFLSILPLALWRLWILQHPEGIPASAWLFNGNGIRFHPSFWYWIVGQRFGKEILGPTGMILISLGLLYRPENKKSVTLYLFAFCSFLYVAVLATGNVQHDYYQALLIPAISMFVGRGLYLLFKSNRLLLPRIFTIPIAMFLFILMIYLTWNDVKGLYQINNDSIVIAGEEANKILPKNAVVIAPYGGDTSFLYYVNRPGFPVIVSSIDNMKKDYGVTDYVSVNFDSETNKLMKEYSVLKKTSQYVIIDLTRKNKAQ